MRHVEISRWYFFCTIACLSSLFFFVSCNKNTENKTSNIESSQAVASTTLLATISNDEKPHSISKSELPNHSMPDDSLTDLFYIDFNQHGKGVAYIANVGNKTHVVHNGVPGKLFDGYNLAALQMSPDAKRVVHVAIAQKKWSVVINGVASGLYDEVGPPVFSPDSKHVAYEVKNGDTWSIVADSSATSPALSYYDKPVYSADSSKIMIVENTPDDQKKNIVICSNNLLRIAVIPATAQPMVISADKNRVAAVSEQNGKYMSIDFAFNKPDVVVKGPLYDSIQHLSISKNGSSLSYLATKGTATYLILDGKEELLPVGEYPWPPVIRPNGKGAGIVISDKSGAYLYQAFSSGGKASKHYKEAADLAYSDDGVSLVYGAIQNEKFIAVINGVEGPPFDRVVSPKFSPDGKYVVYRARKDNLRFVVVADTTGKILRQHQGYERVFEPVFTADGASVAYGVKDGKKLIWKVEKL